MPRLVVLLLTSLLAFTGCSNDTEIAPPLPTSSAARADSAQQVATALGQALTDHDTAAAADVAAPAVRPLLQAVAANVGRLGLRSVGLRYLEDGVVDPQRLDSVPDGTWAATMELTWRLPGWDHRASRAELSVLLHRDDGRARVVGFAPGGEGRVPVWLTGPVEVRRTGRVLIASASGQSALSAAALLRLGRQAVREVGATLRWHGRLVIEVPQTEQQLEQALAAGEKQYASIAAVTTTVDGSAGRRAPLHVFLNPGVFNRLGAQGAQVVMTHETVHVATHANASAAPDWLREGFADYVALSHARVPVAKAGAQAIAKTRKQGPPRQLPSDADLGASAPHIGTAYEEAWLVCRFIAREYGERRLIRFYRAVDGGTPLPEALRQVLDTSEQGLVSGWSRSLTDLARK